MRQGFRRLVPWAAASIVALVWADPTWAYDASWLVKRYQLHWPALREAGEWIQAHPDRVPRDARIMTWFPWELRVTSDRTTILMPRNYNPRRIKEVIEHYGVTHVLWGSFEPPPYFEINPEIVDDGARKIASRARPDGRSGSVSYLARQILSGPPLSRTMIDAGTRADD